MKFEDILPAIRKRLHDEDKLVYDDAELLGYYNDGQELISSTLSALGYEGMVFPITIIENTQVPNNYIRLCGQYPVYVQNGIFYPEVSSIEAQYIGYPASLTSISEEIKLLDVWIPIAIQATVMYAQNTEEFSLKQDMELIRMKLEGLVKARGVI